MVETSQASQRVVKNILIYLRINLDCNVNKLNP